MNKAKFHKLCFERGRKVMRQIIVTARVPEGHPEKLPDMDKQIIQQASGLYSGYREITANVPRGTFRLLIHPKDWAKLCGEFFGVEIYSRRPEALCGVPVAYQDHACPVCDGQ